MAEEKGGLTWLKYGCLGCLGIVVVLVLIAGGIGAAAWKKAESQQVERRVLTPDLPAAEAAPEPEPAAAAAPEGTAVNRIATEAVGRVVLEMSGGGFRIDAARPGEPLRVEADFDPASYELAEDLRPTEDGTWVYKVSFRRTASSFLLTLAEMFGKGGPKVNVFLPVDAPLALVANMSEGGTELDLGGLWLTEAELSFQRGGFIVEVDEPLQAPMDRLVIDGAMGGFVASRLGNASPRVLQVDVNMGGVALDLRGAWTRDAEITLRTSMGGGEVRLPDDVILEGLQMERAAPESRAELPIPVLRFTADSRLEDLKFR